MDQSPHEEETSTSPLRIGRRDPARLTFEWRDGSASSATAAAIRRGCPCAHCVDERTGRPLLDPTTVPEDLTHKDVRLVGHYALAITFGDGHGTGIFTWDTLRRLSDHRPGTTAESAPEV